MRARSSTSASPSGLPAGSTIRTAYVPLAVPASRLSSTRGKPAKRGDVSLDPGSAGGGTAVTTRRPAGSLALGRGSAALDRRRACVARRRGSLALTRRQRRGLLTGGRAHRRLDAGLLAGRFFGDRLFSDRPLGDRLLGDRLLGDRLFGGRLLGSLFLGSRLLGHRLFGD